MISGDRREAELSAAETVLRSLRQRIIEAELRPGTRLVDAAIAQRHGVSRNTAREALRLLAADRLAVSVRNAGYRVRELGIDDIRDLYAARRIVETGAVRQSVDAEARRFEALERAVETGEARLAAGDWSGAGTSNLAFHRALVGLAMSPALDDFFVGLIAQLRLAFAVIPDEGEYQTRWIERDREIAELVLSGAREEAAARLVDYLDDSEARLIDAMRAATRRRMRAGGPAEYADDHPDPPANGRRSAMTGEGAEDAH